MSNQRHRDPAYRAARRYWASVVPAGGVVCHLCGDVIVGPFDLDHVRTEPGRLHPAHPRCNRGEGGRHGTAPILAARLARGTGSLTGGAHVR